MLNGVHILMTLAEDRVARNIWTPPGGEDKVREGQTPRETAVAEVYEEIGLKIEADGLRLIGDPQFIFPTPEYDPYDGIGLIILSYVYTGLWNTSEIRLNRVPEKGCMIKQYKLIGLPHSATEIQGWENKLGVKVYPNYAAKLLELDQMVIEGKL